MRNKDKRVDIDVAIEPDGKVKFTVSGVKGKGCLKYADAIKKALGAEGTTELTHEYWEGELRIEADEAERIESKVKTP